MVPIDALEQIKCPEKLKPLLKHVILHAFSNYKHRLKLIDVEQVACFTSCCSGALLIQLLNLISRQVFQHFIGDSKLAFKHARISSNVLQIELLLRICTNTN